MEYFMNRLRKRHIYWKFQRVGKNSLVVQVPVKNELTPHQIQMILRNVKERLEPELKEFKSVLVVPAIY